MENFKLSVLELIIQTSTNLPADVRQAMQKVKALEQDNAKATRAINIIYDNIDMACQQCGAICQDTGMLTFEIDCPIGINQLELEADIRWAVGEATRRGKLRPNSVDSITGKNSGDNLSQTTPILHFKQWDKDYIYIKLILKGGGCENKNIQYSLPCELEHLGAAGRDLTGVKKCILQAIWQAQGQGCSAGFIGVAIGSDRVGGYACAKEQLFRALDDVNPDSQLAKLEQEIVEEANTLGIGIMGFGGKATLLGCKIAAANRVPASFYVTIAYNCWAFRRLGVKIETATGNIFDWFELAKNPENLGSVAGAGANNVIRLSAPLNEDEVRKLKVGDVVLLSGKIFTGRDAMHKYLMHHAAPVDLQGGVIYHCGPVVIKDTDDDWQIQAAGPTTSAREEPYQAEIIKQFGLRAVIGKGGMGKKTLEGLKNSGAVYLHAIGGAAQFYARALPKVYNVYLLEQFGIPEAMWELESQDFLTIVTMDSHGNSLHAEVSDFSGKQLEKFR
ncbi:MAG: fumarate hydratase [Deltaproteobacteria bacterium]|jgi:fumarate hydratase class I|nr:fumarate hydratase [Deltaproteobacteria bacterium]